MVAVAPAPLATRQGGVGANKRCGEVVPGSARGRLEPLCPLGVWTKCIQHGYAPAMHTTWDNNCIQHLGFGNSQAVEKNAGKIAEHQKDRKRRRDYWREERASRARAATPKVPP